MATPSIKNQAVEDDLANIIGFDRRIHIKNNTCVPPPIGCGGPAIIFKDALSQKEYTISGLCQKCQDSIFGSGEE